MLWTALADLREKTYESRKNYRSGTLSGRGVSIETGAGEASRSAFRRVTRAMAKRKRSLHLAQRLNAMLRKYRGAS